MRPCAKQCPCCHEWQEHVEALRMQVASWKNAHRRSKELEAEVERLKAGKPCNHEHALADICEGDASWRHGGPEYTVQWCPQCGAYRRNNEGEWREPGDE